jgi:hypothetical protein
VCFESKILFHSFSFSDLFVIDAVLVYILVNRCDGDDDNDRRGDPTLPENNYSSNQQNKSGGRFLRRTS